MELNEDSGFEQHIINEEKSFREIISRLKKNSDFEEKQHFDGVFEILFKSEHKSKSFSKKNDIELRRDISKCDIAMFNYREALERLEETLKLSIEWYRGHPLTLEIQYYMGQCYIGLEKFPEALKLLKMTEESQKKKLGNKHRDTILTQHEIARCELQMGLFFEAKKKMLLIQKTISDP